MGKDNTMFNKTAKQNAEPHNHMLHNFNNYT